jgi:hypothetical protein
VAGPTSAVGHHGPVPRRRTRLAVGTVALALLVAACGDDDDRGRPTVGELAPQLAGGDVSEDQADCLARAFVDSDISDEGLRAIVEAGGIDAGDLSEEDQVAVGAAAEEAIRCAAAGG